MKNLIIYGIGKHAELVYSFFKHDSPFEVVAFTVEEVYIDKQLLFDIPVYPFEKIENEISPSEAEMFIAIGPHQINSIREKYFQLAKGKGYTLANYVATKAGLWPDTTYGENTLIDHGTQSHPFVKIGKNCVFICSDLGHHVEIGDNCFITTSVIGGLVTIEDNVFIAMGCTIMSGVRIGKGSIIGMGSLISRDIPPFSVTNSVKSKPVEGLDSRDTKLF